MPDICVSRSFAIRYILFKRDIGGNIDARFEPSQMHLNGDKRMRGKDVRKSNLTFKMPNQKTAPSARELLSDPTIGESEV